MAEPLEKIAATDLFLNVLTQHRQWSSVKEISETLFTAGFDAVLAGGCVRDGLLGVTPKDFDVATNATPDQVEALFEKTISIGKNFGVIAIPLKDGGAIEVATFRKDGDYQDGRHPTDVIFSDREEDARRRDFTVNALFFDLKTLEIVDYVGGLKDLARRCLSVVGDPAARFREDKLRLLRAIRFSGQLDFDIDPATETAIRLFARELDQVSRERIRDEIDKLLMTKASSRGFEALDRLGLSTPVFLNWASFIVPIDPRLLLGSHHDGDLDLRRALLFYPVLKHVEPDRVQERLRSWKYGRRFVEQMIWLQRNENHLRASSPDPSAHFATRALILQKFEISIAESSDSVEQRLYSENERRWMTSLELWTDERAVFACAILDFIDGVDTVRDEALQRRGLKLGQVDPWRERAEDFLKRPDSKGLQGDRIGRELRRLHRELLLR